MKTKTLLSLALALGCLPASAQLIGMEPFDTDGLIGGQTSGTGWNYDNFDMMVTATASDWTNVGGTPSVVGGALVTDGSSAKREFNGPIEGAGDAANDAEDDHERSGAVRGVGQVFFKVDLNRSAGASWSGLSSYDFGAERIFFGVPGAGGATDTVGIEESGVGNTLGTINLTDGETYTLVAVVDFDNQLVGLFVDPSSSDFWDPATGENSADVTRPYTATNWSTAARLGSGGMATWDNLSAAHDGPSVGIAEMAGDEDVDGLPDAYEFTIIDFDEFDAVDNLADVANDGSTDFDGDGSPDSAEFVDMTDPTNPDSDGDGLNDGDEATEGTNPLIGDTDGDCLTDGDEVNIIGTNPVLADSDSGGANDNTELLLGSNPNSGGDDPTENGDLSQIGIDFFDSYADGPLAGGAGGSGFDYDNSITNDAFVGHTTKVSDWSNIGGAPQVQGGRVITQDSSIKREFHGGTLGEGTVGGEDAGAFRLVDLTSENLNDILYAKVELTRRAGADWSGLSLYFHQGEQFFVGVNNGDPDGAGPLPAGYGFLVQDSADGAGTRTAVFDEADGFGNPVAPVADQTYTLVAKFDFDLSEITVFVDPDLGSPEPGAGAPFTAKLLANFDRMDGTGIRLGSGGAGASEWDGLVLSPTWEGLAAMPGDSDGDGMPDDWELTYSLDPEDPGDATSDLDTDGLEALEEFLAGTNPTIGDTDGDGLSDGTEEMAAGTNPVLDDTDGDGLLDGAEVNGTGPAGFTSSPLLVDTDGDGQSDGGEQDINGPSFSDPNDSNDTVGAPLTIIGCDDFESYGDNPIAGLVGGFGFDWENWLNNGPFVGHTGTFADWDGTAMVMGGKLVTQNTLAYRDYNGPGEGPGDDGAGVTDARMGAVNESATHDASVVYFKVELTPRAGMDIAVIGSDDFNAERLAFGVLGDTGFGREWGIREGGTSLTEFGYSGAETPVVDGQTYVVVGKLDFLADSLSLWIDPDLDDLEANNMADVVKDYGATNWSSGVRLESTGTGDAEWDDLVVATEWEQLGKEIVSPPGLTALIVNGYSGGMLSVTASNFPAGQYHLRRSTDAQTFLPFTPAINFDETTPQPMLVPVDPLADPTLLIQAFEGLSP